MKASRTFAGIVLVALVVVATIAVARRGATTNGVAAPIDVPSARSIVAPQKTPAGAMDAVDAETFLAAVRGGSPVLCELAARTLGSRWGWNGSDPEPAAGAVASSRERELVAWALAGERDPDTVDPLADGLADSDPCVRGLAARLLGHLETPAAVERLREGLGAASADTREAAAVGLGFAEDRDALHPLARALGDGEPRVRVAAAWALGRIESPDAIEPLATALGNDPDPRVRQTAAWALGEIE